MTRNWLIFRACTISNKPFIQCALWNEVTNSERGYTFKAVIRSRNGTQQMPRVSIVIAPEELTELRKQHNPLNYMKCIWILSYLSNKHKGIRTGIRWELVLKTLWEFAMAQPLSQTQGISHHSLCLKGTKWSDRHLYFLLKNRKKISNLDREERRSAELTGINE